MGWFVLSKLIILRHRMWVWVWVWDAGLPFCPHPCAALCSGVREKRGLDTRGCLSLRQPRPAWACVWEEVPDLHGQVWRDGSGDGCWAALLSGAGARAAAHP